MNWKYEYPAKRAVHLPTKLSFSIAYDPLTTDRKIKLSGPKPENVSDEQVGRLVRELHDIIQDRYLRKEMTHLLHGPFGGDYGLAATVLVERTKKRVSTRTLQAWMMQPGRPSSRRCPEWAVAALQEHIDHQPDSSHAWKGVASARQNSPEGNSLSHRTQLRERETVKLAEELISSHDRIDRKWKECAASQVPAQLAGLERELRKKVDDLGEIVSCFLSSLKSSESLQELKDKVDEGVRWKYQLDRLVDETATDMRERRNEFASEDGTLPNSAT